MDELRAGRPPRVDWLTSLVEDGPDAITVEGPDGRLMYWNAGAERLYGWSSGEVVGGPASAIVPAEQTEEWREIVASTVRDGASTAFETVRRRKDDTLVDVSMSTSPLREHHGDVVGIAAVARDISPQKARERELSWRATHDELTGLANRGYVSHSGTGQIARLARDPGVVALAFVDIDNLKEINDQFGHARGDEVLQSVARRLSGATRAQDLLARIGGDEFLLLTDPLPDALAAADLAQRLLDVTNGPVDVDGAVGITVSLGLAITDDPCTPVEELVSRGDAAMYRAKSAGGGCYRLARPIRVRRKSERRGVIDLR